MDTSNENMTMHDMRYFNLIYPPIFLAVGVPGNLFSMVIWLRRVRNSPGSTCLFLTILCATDTYVLIHGCARVWLRALGETLFPSGTPKLDLRYMLGCAAPLYTFTFTSDLSVWLIILLSFERFICAWFPMRMKALCHWHRGLICAAATTGFLAFANLPLFALAKSDTESGRCVSGNYSRVYFKLWSYFDFALYSFVPLALIVLSNALILIRLQQARARAGSRQNRSARILRTIVCMCICHFLLTMPIVIYFLTDKYICPVPVPGKRNICDPVNELFIMLQLANHLTHFFIYSCTSTLFKADLMNMCIPRRFHSHPSTTDTTNVTNRNRAPRKSQLFAEFEHRDQTDGLLRTSANASNGEPNLLVPPPTPL